MEITKREIIASIFIVSIMLIIGFFISDKIQDWQNDKNAKYRKSIHINDSDMFEYGMDTNVGNAFVYGELKAVDTVSYPEIKGKYIYIKKKKEKYTKHKREVRHTKKVNGKTKTYYTTEIYWSWDTIKSEYLSSKQIEFCGIVFPIEKINIPETKYIETIKESSRIRYKYYGTGISFKGTIFTDLRNGTISDNSDFFENYSIEDTLKMYTSEKEIIFFWVAWMFLICLLVIGFYSIDNIWLE